MATVVHPSATDTLFNRGMDANMNLSLSYDAPRSTTIDGLPSPVSTPRHSNGVHPPLLPSPAALAVSSPEVVPSTSLAPTADASSRTHCTANVVPPTTDTDVREDTPLPPIPASDPRGAETGLSPNVDMPVSSVGYSPSPSPAKRSSQSPPPNPDAQRVLNESPTSYANGNVNDYVEGLRLFPPSPASSLPQPQNTDPQMRDQEHKLPAEVEPHVWDQDRWIPAQRKDFVEPLDRHINIEPPRKRTKPYDEGQWPESWRARNERPWPEQKVASRTEVRVSNSARAQQPTVVASPPAPAPAQQPLVEEVCVECAMRDQDMADVDVTSPGVWARKSDAAYEDFLQRALAEEEAGIPLKDPKQPHPRGGKLTEANLKLWLTLNPKEPASKRANLESYVRMQQTLLEAEALAHARAMHESRQLSDRARDTYSQLRRSTNEVREESTGLRLSTYDHGRDITLLENGLIVEHVDVRREARERRREAKRAMRGRPRKNSRTSMAEVSSVYSLGVPVAHAEGALAARSSSSRPMSVLTAPVMSDVTSAQSIILNGAQSRSTMSVESPTRRTRFFGMRNLSQGFRSSESLAPSGFSGSMMDMHVALHRENGKVPYAHGTAAGRPSSHWQPQSSQLAQCQAGADHATVEQPKKKKKGLAKFWSIVTGANKTEIAHSEFRNVADSKPIVREEDYPLAPPPPLSYLVNRGGGSGVGDNVARHVSTPSLPSMTGYGAPAHGMSSPSPQSSVLPSPTSLRPLGGVDFTHVRRGSAANTHESEYNLLGSSVPPPITLKSVGEEPSPRGPLAHMTSEPDMRQRTLSVPDIPVPALPATFNGRPLSWRDKSLPPLPGESSRLGAIGEPRSRAVRSLYDNGTTPSLVPPVPGFRDESGRRQSFAGNPSPMHVPTDVFSPYAELGANATSLAATVGMHSKRKPKFTFGTMLGKGRRDSSATTGDPTPISQQCRSSSSEARRGALSSVGMVPSTPQSSVFPRTSLSLASRKNIDSLINQAPDFVAYRYPSGDHTASLQTVR